MAEGIKISEMDEVTEVTENTFIPVIQDGENKKIRFKQYNQYSSEEKIVGKWLDGSPVYEMSFYYDGTIGDETHRFSSYLTTSIVKRAISIDCTAFVNGEFADCTLFCSINSSGFTFKGTGLAYYSNFSATVRYLKK